MALGYGRKGWPVFPVTPNGKTPMTPHGYKDATSDLVVIEAQWTQHPDANIGFCPENARMCVVDVDAGGQYEPQEATATVKTPHGRHYYYSGSLPPTASRIAPHVDTRGHGGYVLLPGSVIDGLTYEWEGSEPGDDLDLEQVPQWVADKCASSSERRVADPGYVEDKPVAIEAFKQYLKRHPIPPEGDGSDEACYRAVARGHDLGLSDQTIHDLIEPTTGFDSDWIWQKIGNAGEYQQNEPGCDIPESSAEKFGEFAARVAANDPLGEPAPNARQKRGRFAGWTPTQGAELPPLTYIDRHRMLPKVPGGCHGTMVGPKASNKTNVALKLGLDAVQEQRARVLYLAGEGGHGLAKQRLAACCKERGITLADIEGQWVTVPNSPNITEPADIAELVEEYSDFAPSLVFVDTLTRATAGVDINSPQAGSAVTEGAIRMAEAFNATVVLIGHPPLAGGERTLGSVLIPDHAFFNLGVQFDKGSGIATLHLIHMKEGPDDFSVHFKRVMVDDVPVLTDCAAGEKPLHAKAKLTETELKRQNFRRQVADAIRSHVEREGDSRVNTVTLAAYMTEGEPQDTRGNAEESLVRRMQRQAGKALRQLVVCDRRGEPVTNPILFKAWSEIAGLSLTTPELS